MDIASGSATHQTLPHNSPPTRSEASAEEALHLDLALHASAVYFDNGSLTTNGDPPNAYAGPAAAHTAPMSAMALLDGGIGDSEDDDAQGSPEP